MLSNQYIDFCYSEQFIANFIPCFLLFSFSLLCMALLVLKSCLIWKRKQLKVIPKYCIAHPFCARVLRNQRVHVQNVRDFPQTKLDNVINSPFLLNEHGDPRFFLQVFAKNSVMKNIFEAEKKFDSRT